MFNLFNTGFSLSYSFIAVLDATFSAVYWVPACQLCRTKQVLFSFCTMSMCLSLRVSVGTETEKLLIRICGCGKPRRILWINFRCCDHVTAYIPCPEKKVPLYFCLYLRKILTDFQNSFTTTLCSKFAVKESVNILP